MRILILCTGNSCRSQMAHGFLQSFDSSLEVHSGGTEPAEKVNPGAVEAMKEAGVDISSHRPEHVDRYTGQEWDYVITVCSDADRILQEGLCGIWFSCIAPPDIKYGRGPIPQLKGLQEV